MSAALSEWRKNWTLVLSATMGTGLTSVMSYSLGLFCLPLNKQFGWSRSEVLAAISITSIVTGFGSPFAGKIIDSFGARRVALGGAVFVSTATASLALVPNSIGVYWGICAVIAVSFMFSSQLIWTSGVASVFEASKGLALAVTLCGSNAIGAVVPIMAAYLIDGYGWRYAFAGLGLFMFLMSVPLAWLFFFDARSRQAKDRKSPAPAAALASLDYGLSPREAFRSVNFWLIITAFFIVGTMLVGLQVNFIPLLQDEGLRNVAAASIFSILNITAIFGRVTGGFLIDRIFAPRLAAALIILPGISCIILSHAAGAVLWIAGAAILIGISLGAEMNMVAYLVGRYFGARHFSQIYGMLFGAFCLGCAIGPVLVGWFYDKFGNYHLVLELMAGGLWLSSLALFFCGPYPKFNTGLGSPTHLDGDDIESLSLATPSAP